MPTDDELDTVESDRLFHALGRRFDWVIVIRQDVKGEIHIYRENCNPVEVLDNLRDAIREAIEGEGNNNADNV